jgi:phage anti-repressor protein
VFGFDVGIEKLSLVSEKALRKQLKILCKYCGWFREQQNETVLVEKKSRSWERAFAEYNKQKPKLRSL